MSIDSSLKTEGKLISIRSVLTRAERIQQMKDDKKFDPKKDKALGLPKTRIKAT